MSLASGSPRVVRLGRVLVGDRLPVLVIAEAGVNHDGSRDKALQLIDVAVAAGADIVKFQMFRAAELVTATAATAEYQQTSGAASQRALLERLQLTEADFAALAAHCRNRGIEFLATPFSPGDVERLARLEVRAIKIASTDLNNTPLLKRAALAGVPLILSTGASTEHEITLAVDRLRAWGAGDRLILLHCVSGYPAPLAAANLRAINTLQERFRVPCGFSDHTQATDIAGWAVAAGACVLEKHFTLDQAARGPDHAMSLNPTQLAAYVSAARAAERALGSGEIGMSPLEADVRSVARKSVVTATPIPAGTVFSAKMLTIKRPGGGIEPDQLDALIGRKAAADIPADAVLTWDLVQ